MNRCLGFLMVLTIISLALVASGCGGAGKTIHPAPEPPQKAAIESAIQDYKKAKESGAVMVPLETHRLALRMLAKTWGSYEYARKELAKMAVTLVENQSVAAVDLQVKEGQRADAEARADRNARHFWYAVAGGLLLGVLGFVAGAIAF